MSASNCVPLSENNEFGVRQYLCAYMMSKIRLEYILFVSGYCLPRFENILPKLQGFFEHEPVWLVNLVANVSWSKLQVLVRN